MPLSSYWWSSPQFKAFLMFFSISYTPSSSLLAWYTPLSYFPRKTLLFYLSIPTLPFNLCYYLSPDLLFASQKVITICKWASGCWQLHWLPSPQILKGRNPLYLSAYTHRLLGFLAPNCGSIHICRLNELTLPWWIYYPHFTDEETWRY